MPNHVCKEFIETRSNTCILVSCIVSLQNLVGRSILLQAIFFTRCHSGKAIARNHSIERLNKKVHEHV